jgi:hypothetical protein
MGWEVHSRRVICGGIGTTGVVDSFLYKTVKGNLNWYLVGTAGIKTVSYSRYGLNLGGLNIHLTLRWRGTISMLSIFRRNRMEENKYEYSDEHKRAVNSIYDRPVYLEVWEDYEQDGE